MDPILIGIIVLAALGIAAPILYFGICKFKGLRPEGWSLDTYSPDVELEFPDDCVLSFQFPDAYPGVHSITKRVSGLKLGDEISIVYEILGGTPKFVAAGLTPELRLYMGAGRYYSHGPNNACALGLGKHVLTVPLTPDNWKTVDGFPFNHDDAHVRQFNDGVPKSNVVGFIFGDEHGNAHGAWDEGGFTRFRLLSFHP